MASGSFPGALLDGQQVVQLHIGKSLQDFRPSTAREPVSMPPKTNGPRLVSGSLGDGGVAALGVDEAGGVFEHGHKITRRNQIAQASRLPARSLLSVISLRMETTWTQAEESWERLKWARINAGFTTATAAAESLGLRKDTYTAYERAPGSSKHTQLDHQMAIKAGRKYRVSWTWLLVGDGTPFDKPSNAHQQRAIQAMATVPEEKQAALAEAIEALVRSAA